LKHTNVGLGLGIGVGEVGTSVGSGVGWKLGVIVGAKDGRSVGNVGTGVGAGVGSGQARFNELPVVTSKFETVDIRTDTSSGISPQRLLLVNKNQSTRFVSCPISDGTEPVKLFALK